MLSWVPWRICSQVSLNKKKSSGIRKEVFCDEGLGKRKEMAFKLQMRKCIHKMLKYVALNTCGTFMNILANFWKQFYIFNLNTEFLGKASGYIHFECSFYQSTNEWVWVIHFRFNKKCFKVLFWMQKVFIFFLVSFVVKCYIRRLNSTFFSFFVN